jgi:hypothetical protein
MPIDLGTHAGIAVRRLQTQRLTGEPFASAVDAVAWLGAVQSQDYAGAKWALGQRTLDATELDLDRLFDDGAILRTHVLRPTWHFVLPDDIRWLVDLTAPRVKARMAYYERLREIDRALVLRSHALLEATLRDSNYLTRSQLAAVFGGAGIQVAGERLGHLLMRAELDGVIVSGPRRGKQMTYALLDERAPSARRLDRDEALADLTRRYFTGHGPAQVQDFAWWADLTVADIKRGLSMVGPALAHEEINGKSYWSSPDSQAAGEGGSSLHLLSNYDEFLVAYRDRSASLDPQRGFNAGLFPHGSILAHVVILNGQVWGCWKRRHLGREIVVELGPLDVLDSKESATLQEAAWRISRFFGVPVSVTGLDES